MNILIIGSGAREHAIAKLSHKSRLKPKIFCCGISLNPGIRAMTEEYWIGDITDTISIAHQAKLWSINMAIIGPEAPLEAGLTDALHNLNIAVVGPKKRLAQIETSKAFTRDLMRQYSIPGLPEYRVFPNEQGILQFLHQLGEHNYVIKANGLMGGKGVKVGGEHLHSFKEALSYCQEIFNRGHSLVIEEKLIGQEFSFMCFSDGTTLVPMPLIQDNKRAFVDDQGPNTGGMGTYSAPNHSLPFLTPSDASQAFKINQLVINALMQETNEKYIGILYGGYMATAHGVYVIEFNARFGDPEALNVLSILESDFIELCCALTEGTLKAGSVKFAHKATVCKYAVPEGYPDNPVNNVAIDISTITDEAGLYLAAVNRIDDTLYATGSRTAAFVGIADSISGAEHIAEQGIRKVKGPLFHREDIGTAQMINKRVEAMRTLRVSELY